MTFAVSADAYDKFMGRYSRPLAPLFADFAGIRPGIRALDVGCGAGALTSELATRLGTESVAAVDPSSTFVDAMRARHPGILTRSGGAEALPFDDDEFDSTLAQLVVHFMTDAVAGLREMRRVTRSGGTLAACVWDHAGGSGPLALFWQAVRLLDPGAHDESQLPGTREGHLAELFSRAGLSEIQDSKLTVEVRHMTFDDWWEPFTLAVGPAGSYVAGLDATRRETLRSKCREMVSSEPFVVQASAWAVRGHA